MGMDENSMNIHEVNIFTAVLLVFFSIGTHINFVLNTFESKLCILGGLFDEETSLNNIGTVSDETAFRL